MAKSEKERDDEFKQCVKEIREFSVFLYYLVRKATFSWSSKGTAFVTARKGCIHFGFNYKFWDRLNVEERLFLALHECYHIFLDHFSRFPKVNRLSNEAMDLAVNHSLLNHFSFDRDNMPLLSRIGVWVDTVIPGKVLLDTLSAEEYLYALQEAEGNRKYPTKDEEGSKGKGSIDDHDKADATELKEIVKGLMSKLSEDIKTKENLTQKESEKVVEDFLNTLGQEVAQEIREAAPENSEFKEIKQFDKKRKTTWVQFSKRLVKRFKGEADTTVWMPDRRVQHLVKDNMFLPSYKEAESKKGRVLIALFLDTSISCDHLRPYFFGFAKALPKEVFEVVAFGFTASSYPIDLTRPRFRTGGTSFSDFEEKFNSLGSKEKYAFVFTDGYASPVTLSDPRRWHWFLDQVVSINNAYAIPKDCPKYCLSDFE